MGVGGSIPEDVRDRFATCELEVMQRKFEELAKEGSFRGKTFDYTTFNKHFMKDYPEVGKMIFSSFDENGNKKIDLVEFVQGISRCTRGTTEAKQKFIFGMFDQDKSMKISRKELCQGIGSPFFGPKGEQHKERKKRIENTVNEVFNKYDKDKDGYLSVKEFIEWANESPEVEKLFELFKRIDRQITESSESSSTVMEVTHDTHVGLTASGEMTIDKIPPSWVKLFKEAGASEEELNNPTLVVKLMGIVAEKLNQKAYNTPPTDRKSTEETSGSSPTTPETKTKTETETKTPPPQKQDVPGAPDVPDAPPPPPSKVPPPASPASDRSDLLAGIKGGVELHHTEPTEKKVHKESSSAILEEIRQKPKLRHVDEHEIEKMSTDDRNDLTSVLARAILAHRGNMNVDRDGNEITDENDDWDD